MLNTHTGVEHFFFWRSRKGFFTSAPQLSKRAAAQITPRSRVGELALQRGERRLLPQALRVAAKQTQSVPAKAEMLAGSKVQIKV